MDEDYKNLSKKHPKQLRILDEFVKKIDKFINDH